MGQRVAAAISRAARSTAGEDAVGLDVSCLAEQLGVLPGQILAAVAESPELACILVDLGERFQRVVVRAARRS